MNVRALITLTLTITLGMTVSVHAATVNQGTLTTFQSESEVDTTGSITHALDFGNTGAGDDTDGTPLIGGIDFSEGNMVDGQDYKSRTPTIPPDLKYMLKNTEYGAGPVDMSIGLAVTQNAAYKIQLFFFEPLHTSSGRVFHIDIEGTRVVENLDVQVAQAAAGAQDDYAVLYTGTFESTDDGVLNITLEQQADAPVISGLTVEYIPPAGTMVSIR